MPTRSKSRNRCERCSMRPVLCVCPLIPTLSLQTRLTILMHWREVEKTTNTGRLASLALSNSEIRIRGKRDQAMKTDDLVTDQYQSLLLFPDDEAVELTPEYVRSFSKPIHLIVSDGSWKQARKVATREASLKNVPRVKLGVGKGSSYFLRHSPHPEKLSTFEAIAQTLGMIEGSHVQEPLEKLFEVMIERTLWSRGKVPLAECKTGIPEAAVQAFFEDGRRGASIQESKDTEVLEVSEIFDEPDFYYDELGRMVFTAAYHLKRGACCGNGCRHCPY